MSDVTNQIVFVRMGHGMKIHRSLGDNITGCNHRNASGRHGRPKVIASADVSPQKLCSKCFPNGLEKEETA